MPITNTDRAALLESTHRLYCTTLDMARYLRGCRVEITEDDEAITGLMIIERSADQHIIAVATAILEDAA
jgi:hypothetical protein